MAYNTDISGNGLISSHLEKTSECNELRRLLKDDDKPLNGGFVDSNDPSSLDSRSSATKTTSEETKDTPTISQFPAIDTCIPRWEGVFPWVCWDKLENEISCLECSNILRAFFHRKIKQGVIFTVTKPDDIFLIAKLLRQHNDGDTHSICSCLSNSSKFLSFMKFYNMSHSEVKGVDDFMNILQALNPKIETEIFTNITKFLGKKTEKNLCQRLKEAKFFSIVADQCRGLIVVRFINSDNEPEEQVLWSYISIWDKTPLTYLDTLDLNFERMVIYIANTPCQQCPRCSSNRITNANLSPRAPSTSSFCKLLWQLDFLQPLEHVLSSVHKLWKLYPYMFAKTFSIEDFQALDSYHFKPFLLINIINKFKEIKEVCSKIYQDKYVLEALGVSMVEIQNDNKHIKILTLLQEILDTANECSKPERYRISEKEIVKLNQAFSSLKLWSAKAEFVTVQNPTIYATVSKPNSEKVWEFLNLVEKFIDENQKGIYYNGKNSIPAFLSLCQLKNYYEDGKAIYDKDELEKCFKIVNDALSPFLANSNSAEVMQNLMEFYAFASRLGVKINSCIDALQYFKRNTELLETYAHAYNFLTVMATMPFQPCAKARSLFGAYVHEQKVDNSVWNKFKENLKPWVLYIQQSKNLSHRTVLNWWLESFNII